MSRTAIQGMLTPEDLKSSVKGGEIDTILTVFPDMYGRLVGKRIAGDHFLQHVKDHGMHACDYLLACDMEMDPVPGYKFTSWDTGYGDFRGVPDLKSLRRIAWLPKTALVLCDLVDDKNGEPVEIAPRQMLTRQLERARNMGFEPMAGSELELFLFKETYESAKEKDYHGLKTFGWYIEDYHILQGTKEEELVGAIRNAMNDSGIPIEFSKGEWGPGQHEINLKYAGYLEMADRHTIYKQGCKEIALNQEMAVSFMAKWDEKLAGSSMHLHLSLWDENGKENLFRGNEQLGPVMASKTFRWFLGGWLKYAREFSAFYAPNVNSYKRYQAGSFAPTAIAWSYDNRTSGFRIVGHGDSLRIECRIPGADANPYLAFAASLAAGLEGIENKMEPTEIFSGDAYQSERLPQVPKTLNAAIDCLKESKLAIRAFGEEVVEHYLHFFETEQRKFDEVVTCWERMRYFERG